MGFVFEDNIIKGDDAEIKIKDGIGTACFKAMQNHPDRIALVLHESQEYETYKTYLTKCIRTAIGLKKRNIGKGDIVIVCAPNSINGFVPAMASYFIGATPFIITPLYAHDTLKEIKKTNSKIIFSEKSTAEDFKSFVEENCLKSEIVVYGSNFEEEFFKPQENEDEFQPTATENIFETCTMVETSGTSGAAKNICLHHYNFLRNIPSFTTSETPQASITHCCWNWFSTTMGFIASLINGNLRVISSQFYGILPPDYDGNKFWEMIQKYKISTVVVNPTIACVLFDQEKIAYDVSSLKIFFCTGAPFLEGHSKRFKSILPRAIIWNPYGFTEVGGASFFFNLRDKEHFKLSQEEPLSVGVPIDGFWVKVVDPDTETILGPNQLGELRLKSKVYFSNGYYQSDWSDKFDNDGFYKTGDIVYFDKKFRFFIKDRIHNIICSNGHRLIPSDYESLLLMHPAVQNVAVVGVPLNNVYETAIALVVLKKEATVSEEELVDMVNAKFEKEYEFLTGGVKFIKRLPLSPSGKVLKLKLRTMVIENKLDELL